MHRFNMSSEPLGLIKNHLEKNVGNIGTLIYHKSIIALNIGRHPSRNEIEKLILNIEKKLTNLYGIDKSYAISEELREALIRYDESLENKIKETLDDFFDKKGMPGESDAKKIAKHLISGGYNQDEKKLIETIEQLSKKKIISSLNDYVVTNEIKAFLNRSPRFTQVDVEKFINYLKVSNPDVNDVEVKNMIEKERLYKKFSQIDEINSNKIHQQCIALFDSGKNKESNPNFRYILSDKDFIRFVEALKFR
jgi:hypothetical protein